MTANEVCLRFALLVGQLMQFEDETSAFRKLWENFSTSFLTFYRLNNWSGGGVRKYQYISISQYYALQYWIDSQKHCINFQSIIFLQRFVGVAHLVFFLFVFFKPQTATAQKLLQWCSGCTKNTVFSGFIVVCSLYWHFLEIYIAIYCIPASWYISYLQILANTHRYKGSF